LELWRVDDEVADEVYCSYAHASKQLATAYPDVLVGHYPYNDVQTALSTDLCQLADEADTKHCWRTKAAAASSHSGSSSTDTDAAKAACKTEMALMIQGDKDKPSAAVFLVGFAIGRSSFQPQKVELAQLRLRVLVSSTAEGAPEGDASAGVIPQWAPRKEFNFPVRLLQIRQPASAFLSIDDFTGSSFLRKGSRVDIYTAVSKASGTRVVIKMLRKDFLNDALALQEFTTEHGVCARISHPNIVRLLGAGKEPRPFLVLEMLEGGTLQAELSKIHIPYLWVSRPSLATSLQWVRELAEALDYLHHRMHPEASVLHRDLKPDNMGFDEDGSLKLFDLGLCTCIYRTKSASDTYSMSRNTGSMRYMAPEVLWGRPYNDKVDAYSFGILAWQILTREVPFANIALSSFAASIEEGLRPALPDAWPIQLSALLRRCWAVDYVQRPSFENIVSDLMDIAAILSSSSNNI
jgi:hypothetical protein